MLNVINNGVKGDIYQDFPNNMCDMLLIEFLTQRKDEQVALVKSEVNRRLVQIRYSEINVKATV